jgi:NADH-quinone oxidoreductase subunit I
MNANYPMSQPELSIKAWFTNIWEAVLTTYKGMSITFKYVYGVKPVTIEYPEIKEELPANSRSRLYNDAQNCISCLQCANACPVDCIYISAVRRTADAPAIKTKDGTAIKLDLTMYTIDTALCCYCGLCTTVCPTECLTHTQDYEFSSYTVSHMKYDYLAPEIRAWRTRIVQD